MNTPGHFRSTAGASAVAAVSFLMLAGTARAEDTPAPRATMSRQVPTPATGAGVGTHVLSINGDSFLPVDSVTGWGVQTVNDTAVRFPTWPSVGGLSAYFTATFQIPTGAVLDEVHMEVYANAADAPMTFSVVSCDGSAALNGCFSLADVSTSGAPGATYIGAVGLNETIDNLNKSYFIQLDAGTNLVGANAWRRAVVYYHLQVSPAPATPDFGDVPASSPQFQFIEALYQSGITAGCGGGNYCPDQAVTRGQVAVFLAKALGLWWPN